VPRLSRHLMLAYYVPDPGGATDWYATSWASRSTPTTAPTRSAEPPS